MGLTHIYCGNGKGKTTTAFGLAMRAAGRSKKILIAQFLKNNDSGERNSAALLRNITLLPCPENIKFTFDMNDQEKKDMAVYCKGLLDRAFFMAEQDAYDMLILDEVLPAVDSGIIERQTLVDLIINKPSTMELILTGRCEDKSLYNYADYVSEINDIKHPYSNGITARIGIEK